MRKYRNTPVVVDGVRFDSKRESIRYHVLRLLERSGDIKDLKRQVRYPLHVNGVKVGEYRGDFQYFDCLTGQLTTEDTKGFVTDLFRWKAKHFAAEYGREIKVTA